MTGIEALNELAEEIMYTHNDGKTLTHYDSVRIKIIQQDLDRLKKLEKAIEILEKKRLSIVYFVYEIRADNNKRNYSDYKYWTFNRVKSKDDLLTEDEFELLKEFLK